MPTFTTSLIDDALWDTTSFSTLHSLPTDGELSATV
jgi:hypothetical protein